MALAVEDPITVHPIVGGLLWLLPFFLAWIFHWLPHDREVEALSAEQNSDFRALQWMAWSVWVAIGLFTFGYGVYSELLK